MVKPFIRNTSNTQLQYVNGFVFDAIDLVWFTSSIKVSNTDKQK